MTNDAQKTERPAAGADLIIPLIGSALADTLTGGAGDDTLRGGLGNDSLTGAGGADTFEITSGTDVVTDVGLGNDVLQVSGGASVNATVNQAWTASSGNLNNGTANLGTAGFGVNLSAITSGANGWSVTNSGGAALIVGSARPPPQGRALSRRGLPLQAHQILQDLVGGADHLARRLEAALRHDDVRELAGEVGVGSIQHAGANGASTARACVRHLR